MAYNYQSRNLCSNPHMWKKNLNIKYFTLYFIKLKILYFYLKQQTIFKSLFLVFTMTIYCSNLFIHEINVAEMRCWVMKNMTIAFI